jgi:3-phenylpropionate/trans-cinnamate dioxygenase ferredoxin component
MGFRKVADTSELPAGTMKKVSLDGKDVLLVNVDGAYYAIDNKCTHLGGSLVEGTLEGNVVTCPRHGSRFDVKTGKAVGKAKVAFIKMMPKDEKSYAAKVESTDILLETDGD